MAGQHPVIGIACAVLPARWGPWDQSAAVVGADYVRQVQAAGGIAMVVPPQACAPEQVLDVLDGLLLTGGNDLESSLYGEAPHSEAEPPDPERDAWECALVLCAMERDIPFLGICRGMQVMNVACRGTLTQHLPEALGSTDHRRRTGTFDGNDHLVDMQPGSLAARAAGELVHSVPSHHHQAVDVLGDGLVLTGRSSGDGVPEAIEAPGCRFALGVQWHPEADPTSPVIAALVAAARGA